MDPEEDYRKRSSERLVSSNKKKLEPLRVGETFRSKLTTEVDPFIELEYNRRVHRIESFVLAEKLAEDAYSNFVTLMMPKTVWEHFKASHGASWWLGWLVRRRPVQYTKFTTELIVKVKRYASYPEADIALPGLGRPVRWEMVETEVNKKEE